MSWLSKLFKGGDNPADAAMPYLNQIPGMEQQNYNPYIQRGSTAYDAMEPSLNKMTTDPTGFIDELMKHYQESQGYKLKRDEGLRAAGNTAAAGGMRGSLGDIETESRLADSLLGEDMQQWLMNVLGVQKEGMEGQSHLYDTGFDATKNLTGDLSNVLGTQASLAFQGSNEKNKRQSDLFSGLMKAFGGAAGLALPGGGTVGGALASKFI